MDYNRFIAQLPSLYHNWGQEAVQPKSAQFQVALSQLEGMTTANVTQLLNFAVACMEPGEVYCEVGCSQGATLIGALLNHPNQMAYAIDNFSEFDPLGENQTWLMQNLADFGMEEQVFFCNQDFEKFFADLRELQTGDRIGVYLYDGAHDYRSQLMGLLLVKPFLADRALIIVDDSNWDVVKQANWDFIASHPQCQLLLDLPTPAKRYDEMRHCSFWNGLQILSWDAQTSHTYSWFDLQQVRNPSVIQAIYQISPVFQAAVRTKLNDLYQAAQRSQAAGQLTDAVGHYQAILQQDPKLDSIWHELGITYFRLEKYDEAAAALTQAIAINANAAAYHYSFGLVLQTVGQIMPAAEQYQQAIALDPTLTDAYNNLGNLVTEHGDPHQAELIYQQAIAQAPNHIGSYLNLGNCLLIQGKVDQAIATYATALQREPANASVRDNLEFARNLATDEVRVWQFAAENLYQRQRYQQATVYLEKLVAAGQTDIATYLGLVTCYERLHQQQAVIATCQRAIVHHPATPELHNSLIRAFQEVNQTEAAIAQAETATQQFPDDLLFRLYQHLLLPSLYQSEAEIERYRQQFTAGLQTLISQIRLITAAAQKNAVAAIGQHKNFFLPYQNRCDRDLQQQYGRFAHDIMATAYPQWVQPLAMPAGKIRIGYVSACLRDHTIGKLMLGWFRHHDRSRFQIHSYHLFDIDDHLTQEFRQHSDVFYQNLTDIETICQQIRNDQLHILVFLEIGMQSLMTQIAALRLAPVQCTTWAHPVTSGLPTVDYFLSSDLMEPGNAQEHYTEQLIRLPNIAIAFAKPEVPAPTKARSAFQLRDDAVVYLNSQMLSKYLPAQDAVLAVIAQRVPQAQFVFIARPNQTVADQFQQRLRRAFAALDLDSDQYCVMLPPLNQSDYWQLNQLCDVFLDSFGWSGGHTTLEAIACGLPIVTWPGEFMRGRHSAAILQMLGVTTTIATNATEYINIAVRLAEDPRWRKEIVQQMGDRHAHLYDDRAGIAALETFYQTVTDRAG